MPARPSSKSRVQASSCASGSGSKRLIDSQVGSRTDHVSVLPGMPDEWSMPVLLSAFLGSEVSLLRACQGQGDAASRGRGCLGKAVKGGDSGGGEDPRGWGRRVND